MKNRIISMSSSLLNPSGLTFICHLLRLLFFLSLFYDSSIEVLLFWEHGEFIWGSKANVEMK